MEALLIQASSSFGLCQMACVFKARILNPQFHRSGNPKGVAGFKILTEFKSHNRTERDSQGVGRDILIPKKLFLERCGQFPVTQLTSGEMVDFRKTRFHPKKIAAKVERCEFDLVKISCFS